MKVRTPGGEGLADAFGCEANVSAITSIPTAISPRLAELEEMIEVEASLVLARDGEKRIVAVIAGDNSFDSLCFAEDGRVAKGGVSQPLFVDTVADLPPF